VLRGALGKGLDRLTTLLRDPRAKVTLVAVVFVGGVLASLAAGQAEAVLKGVIVGGIPVSGLDADELMARLRAPANAIQDRQMTLMAGTRSWATTPVAAGITVDLGATAERALRVGRENPARWVGRTFGGKEVHLTWVASVDRRALEQRVARLASDVRLEAANGQITFQGSNVVVTPPSEGVTLIEDDAARVLVKAAMRPPRDDRLMLPVTITKPTIDARDVEMMQAQAQAILTAPVDFIFRDQRASLPPDRVAAALKVEVVPAEQRAQDEELALRVDPEELRRQLVAVAPALERPARDAAFVVGGEAVRLTASQEGWTADTTAGVAPILALSSGGPRVPIVLPERPLAPTLTTEAAQQLGIVQQTSVFRTTFDSHNAPRVANIDRMASAIDGKVIRPGETFSLNGATGPRTPDNGYQEAQVIVDGELVPGLGGGVCQVGTTLFNAAADAGLEVLSRTNHSLYISHYPLGRDATVNYGHQDLRFRNDTPYGILLKAALDTKGLTVSLFSTPLHRTVQYEVSPQVNPKDPAVRFVDDPALPTGVEQVLEPGKPGFDVTVTRRVLTGDQVLREDRFVSKYRPWKRIVRRGTGPAVTPSPAPAPLPPPSPGSTPAPSPVPTGRSA
jgi:vancomycin resistance protein YoaR